MARNIFIGDTVRTAYGDGEVVDARSWREAISGMNDYEAKEFSDKCRVEAGNNFTEDWVEILVNVGGMKRRLLGKDVQVLEGRNDG